MRPRHRRIPDGCQPPAAVREATTSPVRRWRAERGAGGEAWAPPPLPTPWANRQGNPGSRGSCPSSRRCHYIDPSTGHVETGREDVARWWIGASGQNHDEAPLRGSPTGNRSEPPVHPRAARRRPSAIDAATRRKSVPYKISSRSRDRRRRQFGCASVVPGRFACSPSASTSSS